MQQVQIALDVKENEYIIILFENGMVEKGNVSYEEFKSLTKQHSSLESLSNNINNLEMSLLNMDKTSNIKRFLSNAIRPFLLKMREEIYNVSC